VQLAKKWKSNFTQFWPWCAGAIFAFGFQGCKCAAEKTSTSVDTKVASAYPEAVKSFISPNDWRFEINEKGCENDPDFRSDFDFKTSNLEEVLARYKMKTVRTDLKACGYTLVKGSESKQLEPSGTDIDLLIEIKDFYHLPDLQE
jgi:hypothetical protein